MNLEDLESLIRVELASDGLSARAHLQPGIDPDVLTDQVLTNLIQGRGVEVTAEVQRRAEALVTSYRESGCAGAAGVVSEGTAPVHGQDGRFEFEAHLRPKETRDEAVGDDAPPEEGTVDHYRRSSIRAVRAGERIGRIIDPKPGQDGRDITGKTIAAREGKPMAIRDDDTIRKQPDGSVFAQVGGAIEFKAPVLRIVDQVHIAGYVDFSTGHIDFCGDVRVDKGVRDCFEVRAEREIVIRGLVEAAYISAEQDVALQGGMAGREKGWVRAGRDLKAKYLDGTRVAVGRDLIVEREVINCRIDVGRSFKCENGALTGGVLLAGDACVIGQLGGESGVETEVVLGRIDELERLAGEAEELAPRLSREAARAEKKLAQLKSAIGRLTPQQAEELTELEFRAQAARSKAEPLSRACERVRDLIAMNTTVDLLVQKRLFSGVRLYVGTKVAQITEPLKGPVRIMRDGKELVIRDERMGTTSPLSRFARVLDHEAYTGPTLTRIRRAGMREAA